MTFAPLDPQYCRIDTGPSIAVETKYLLLAISFVMAVNTVRLYRKRKRGESAYYDGQEAQVTAFDIALSGALTAVAIAACVYEWSLVQ